MKKIACHCSTARLPFFMNQKPASFALQETKRTPDDESNKYPATESSYELDSPKPHLNYEVIISVLLSFALNT